MLKKTDKLLYAAAAILLLTYAVSYSKKLSSTDKRVSVKSALVNPENKDKITSFTLQDNNGLLNFQKKEGFWCLYEENENYSVPASNKLVEDFLNEMIKIHNMYKISDPNMSKKTDFSLDSKYFPAETQISFKYMLSDGRDYNLLFGNKDFSQANRYISAENNASVYEVENTFEPYLTTNVQNWSEPYIISQQVFGSISEEDVQNVDFNGKKNIKINVQKLLELRHGGLFSIPSRLISSVSFLDMSNRTDEMNIYLGNKNFIDFAFVKISDEAYCLIAAYYDSTKSEPVYEAYMKISLWTYNKIKEIIL